MSENLSKIDACILDFEEIFVTLTKLDTLFLKINKNTIIIYSIDVYKIIDFLSHDKTIFFVVDLILIRRISIIINVYFLY